MAYAKGIEYLTLKMNKRLSKDKTLYGNLCRRLSKVYYVNQE